MMRFLAADAKNSEPCRLSSLSLFTIYFLYLFIFLCFLIANKSQVSVVNFENAFDNTSTFNLNSCHSFVASDSIYCLNALVKQK